MSRYTITRDATERTVQTYRAEASSPEEALRMYARGELELASDEVADVESYDILVEDDAGNDCTPEDAETIADGLEGYRCRACGKPCDDSCSCGCEA